MHSDLGEKGRPAEPGGKLRDEIRQRRPFASPAEEAFLNLLRTAYALSRQHAGFLEPFGLTPTQYNALRILAGSHPDPLPCRQIGRRMVTPVPDVTRLVERLEGKGLVNRRRAARDRRVVAVGITPAGRRLLAEIEAPLAAWLESRVGRLGEPALRRLSRLLERLREDPPPPPG